MIFINSILAAILSSTSPVLTEEVTKTQIVQEQSVTTKMGKEAIAQVRASYEQGEFNSFFEEMNASYEKAKKENGLDGLVEMRKNRPAIDQEKFIEKMRQLELQRNRELVSAAQENDSLFAQKAKSAAATLSTPEQEQAISKLNALHIAVPQLSENKDHERLVAIDLEYEYKMTHLFMPGSNVEQTQEKLLALHMDKMKKMEEAAKDFQDAELKQIVGLSAANLDERLARIWDLQDLNDLANGKIKATSPVEEKIGSVISSYSAQFKEIVKEVVQN